MRRVLSLFAAASLVIGLTAATAAPEKGKWARGKVTAMAGDTLTVDVKGQPMTFTVDKTTEVVKAGAGTKAREMAKTGKTPTLADIVAVGDEVEVSYTEADGKMHATMVRGGVSAAPMTSADASKKTRGVVSDVSGTSLSVKSSEGETLMFAIDAKTKVIGTGLGTKTREKKAEGTGMTLTDAVAKGDTVMVTYKVMGDVNQATSVTVVKKGT